jgi:hypothetical protein
METRWRAPHCWEPLLRGVLPLALGVCLVAALILPWG